MSTKRNGILILDFGSQYSQLITRMVRERYVYSRVVPYYTGYGEIRSMAPEGIIISGSPRNVLSKDSMITCDRRVFELGVPVLGICYGMQLLTHLLGGRLKSGVCREYGRAELSVERPDKLFEGLPSSLKVWMSHADMVVEAPQSFTVLARTKGIPVAAIADGKRRLYGVQFHPEVSHTPDGGRILENFVFRICNCKPDWTMSSFVDDAVKEIRSRVGNGKVICAYSGGVDSTVTAKLLDNAVGERLICVFVNNGLLRKGEARLVRDQFRKLFGRELQYCDASGLFIRHLDKVVDPEKKRKIIGKQFIRVFEKEANKHGDIGFLAQGTLYPDVIESVSPSGGPSSTIKSHHNVGGLPKRMNLKLLEPLRELFKDEVRALGREMGIPQCMLDRQPFPGPGLATRVMGPITKKRLDILREADSIVLEEITRAGLYEKLWQSFAVLIPVRTVGVMGDRRTYEYLAAVRAVTSRDAMTADWALLPHKLLGTISERIVREVKGINRVAYDITSKPPGTIEWQ